MASSGKRGAGGAGRPRAAEAVWRGEAWGGGGNRGGGGMAAVMKQAGGDRGGGGGGRWAAAIAYGSEGGFAPEVLLLSWAAVGLGVPGVRAGVGALAWCRGLENISRNPMGTRELMNPMLCTGSDKA